MNNEQFLKIDNHYLCLWYDEGEDGGDDVWQISISETGKDKDDDNQFWCCFGQTDFKSGKMTVCDHGLVSPQFLTEPQKAAILSLGLEFGMELFPLECWETLKKKNS